MKASVAKNTGHRLLEELRVQFEAFLVPQAEVLANILEWLLDVAKVQLLKASHGARFHAETEVAIIENVLRMGHRKYRWFEVLLLDEYSPPSTTGADCWRNCCLDIQIVKFFVPRGQLAQRGSAKQTL
jgi:hypothetical protein